jgi:hypothetical protein
MDLLIQAAALAKAAKVAKEKRPLLWRRLILKAHKASLRGYFRGGYLDAGFARSVIIALAARCKSSGARIICSPRRPALTLMRS